MGMLIYRRRKEVSNPKPEVKEEEVKLEEPKVKKVRKTKE